MVFSSGLAPLFRRIFPLFLLLRISVNLALAHSVKDRHTRNLRHFRYLILFDFLPFDPFPFDIVVYLILTEKGEDVSPSLPILCLPRRSLPLSVWFCVFLPLPRSLSVPLLPQVGFFPRQLEAFLSRFLLGRLHFRAVPNFRNGNPPILPHTKSLLLLSARSLERG